MEPLDIDRDLAKKMESLRFGAPAAYVYNPLVYAWRPHQQYVERYGLGKREVLFVGMNPGPWGMAQTGVPFGEVGHVRDWLGIYAPVDKPAREHPSRPIQGFSCPRHEVSGLRLWGWAKERFGAPQAFFKRFYVLNYCPLMFVEKSGKNLTPDKLPVKARAPLLAACDLALRRLAEYYEPKAVVGIGSFAQARAAAALDGLDIRIGTMLHPSPANPAANRGWAQAATRALQSLDLL